MIKIYNLKIAMIHEEILTKEVSVINLAKLAEGICFVLDLYQGQIEKGVISR